jgi:membrane carboxypeptidase/penicillin-binding protein
VTSALEGAVDRGTGRRVRAIGYRGPLAGKTGTSDDYRDGWFIGYTPQLAVGVWVGFDDEQSLGIPGARTALPIFTAFLKDAIGAYGGSKFRPPHGVERIEVVSRQGYPSGLRCDGEPEWFLESFAPTSHCNSWWLPSVGSAPSGGRGGFRWPFSRSRD